VKDEKFNPMHYRRITDIEWEAIEALRTGTARVVPVRVVPPHHRVDGPHPDCDGCQRDIPHVTFISRGPEQPSTSDGRRKLWDKPVVRCAAEAVKGTGTGVCDRILDAHGNCDRASQHVDWRPDLKVTVRREDCPVHDVNPCPTLPCPYSS
jgi:hypothetical protein